jgi:hypothetical protein
MAKPFSDKMDAARAKAFEKLNVAPDKRAILTLDGGGMRGMLTIQLLKALEATAGMPCYDLFDMVAGTSTGGIMAGLIVSGHTALEIEKLYTQLVTQVFDHKVLGNRYINPPAFSKEKYRSLLQNVVADVTLEKACELKNLDLMITSQDLAAAEETFFSCFRQPDGSYYGTYKDVLLRAVMEATMSAPTYFNPLERFVDGGSTTYNNPALAAYMEAVSFSRADKREALSDYKLSSICLFSFGTGISRQFLKPMDALHPHGIDIVFWLNWVMTATGQDASAMQVDTFRSPMIREAIDFRRFQISLDPTAMKLLPDTDQLNAHKYGSSSLRGLTEEELGNIDMADVTKMDLMQLIGQQMAQFIITQGGAFTKDLAVDNRDLLVTTSGDIARIKRQLAEPEWLKEIKP